MYGTGNVSVSNVDPIGFLASASSSSNKDALSIKRFFEDSGVISLIDDALGSM